MIEAKGETGCYTYQKECIGVPSVQKKHPACPVVRSLTTSDNFCKEEGDDDADELVATVGNKVEKLAVVRDGEKVHGYLENNDLEYHYTQRGGSGGAQKLGVEGTSHPSENCGKQDIRNKRHDGYVHVWRIEVVSRREILKVVLLLRDLARRICGRRGQPGLLTSPRLVPPGEQDEKEFADNVGVRDVEIVFQSWD